MKLSASINFFKGEELLLHTVHNIRPLVEHLSIVYQETSNWNETISDKGREIIEKLKNTNLVDDLICFYPDFNQKAAINEFRKREIGLNLAKQAQATHFLLMDADEFYIPEQFENIKKVIENENISYSCVHSYFYLHKPYYRSEKLDITNVCFITKITPELLFEFNGDFPIEYVDPTRRMVNTSGKFKFFDTETIAMHHMNFVRQNFISKLTNTSSASNIDFIKKAESALTHWEWPNTFSFPNKPDYNIIQVKDIFNLGDIGFQASPKILITNHFLRDFTGSEIATLDLVKDFLEKGYRVTIGTFTYAEPLKSEFDKINIRFLDLNNATSEYFDLIWAHHFTTLDSCLIDIGMTADKVIFSSLSPYEPLESPPLSIDKVNIVLANSYETKEVLINMGIENSSIEIFPNPVSDAFFTDFTKDKFSLKKLAIVSNHIPTEVKDTIPLLQNHGIEVKIFGIEGEFKLITPDVLKEFDAVITIGRTVQYCLAMSIPVYCYDRFGGPGWIKESNIQTASEFNFSGRCVNHIKISSDISYDILNGFEEMKFEMEFYRNYARERYLLNTLIGNVLSKLVLIQDKTKFDMKKIYKNIGIRQKYFFTNNYNQVNELEQLIKNQDTLIEERDSYIKVLEERSQEKDDYINKIESFWLFRVAKKIGYYK